MRRVRTVTEMTITCLPGSEVLISDRQYEMIRNAVTEITENPAAKTAENDEPEKAVEEPAPKKTARRKRSQ